MTSGFYYRAHRTRLQEIVQPVGADGGRGYRKSFNLWVWTVAAPYRISCCFGIILTKKALPVREGLFA
jgi:hypothetical protein